MNNGQGILVNGANAIALSTTTIAGGTNGQLLFDNAGLLGEKTYTSSTWTPADGSGAGLVFTGVTGIYIKIGLLVLATFRLTYPTTVDATSAKITLPFTNSTAGTTMAYGIVSTNAASPNAMLAAYIASAGTGMTFDGTSGLIPTNALLTGAVVTGTIMYQASS